MHAFSSNDACATARDEVARLRPATRVVVWLIIIASLVFLALPVGAHEATAIAIG